jgi:hypothetical protein
MRRSRWFQVGQPTEQLEYGQQTAFEEMEA